MTRLDATLRLDVRESSNWWIVTAPWFRGAIVRSTQYDAIREAVNRRPR